MGCHLNPNSTWPTTQAMQPSPAPSAAALAEGPRPADAALQTLDVYLPESARLLRPAELPPGSIPLPLDDLAHSHTPPRLRFPRVEGAALRQPDVLARTRGRACLRSDEVKERVCQGVGVAATDLKDPARAIPR